MTRFAAEMNRPFTALCGESFGACASIFLLIIAGIAGAMSVLFIARRLVLPVLVGAVILLAAVLLVSQISPHRKSTNRS